MRGGPSNTMIERRVAAQVEAGVAAINRGEGGRKIILPQRRPGERPRIQWSIGGRTYGMHENGALFPISGDGFHTMSGPAYEILKVYNDEGGPSMTSTQARLRSLPWVRAQHVAEADRIGHLE